MRQPANARTNVTLARLAGLTRICFGFVTIPAHHLGASPKNYFVGAGHRETGDLRDATGRARAVASQLVAAFRGRSKAGSAGLSAAFA